MALDESKILKDVAELKNALKKAATKLTEQQEELKKLTALPYMNGVVVAVHGRMTNTALKQYILAKRVKVEILHEGSEHHGEWATPSNTDSSGTIKLTYPDGGWDIYDLSKHGVTFRVPGIVNEPTATVVVDGKFYEVPAPTQFQIQVGQTVCLHPDSMAIVANAPTQFGGESCYVESVNSDFCEVNHDGTTRTVFVGKGISPEKGDRVLVDASISVIVKNMGKDNRRFTFTANTNIGWDDIGGLEEAKRALREIVELPFTHQNLFKFYKKQQAKGILLYGPPGCGKTMLGKATATALQKSCNKSADSGFLYIKGPEILDKFVGTTEATIRAIFEHARAHKKEHGFPAVIFLDEADAVLGRRGSGISSDVERTIVPMFLTEMDGLEESGALMLLATNRPDILDPAVVREGRVDRRIKIPRPDENNALDILTLAFKDVPLDKLATKEAATLARNELYDQKRVLYKIFTKEDEQLHFRLSNIVSGGMLVNIAEQATSLAFHRNLKGNSMNGITKGDIVAAVNNIESQARDISHKDEISEFVYDFKDSVTGIKKVSQN